MTLTQTESSALASQNPRKRQVQNVSTKFQRKAVIEWMIAHVEITGCSNRIASQAVQQFPHLFRSKPRAHREKARSWWKTRTNFLDKLKTPEDRSLTVVNRRIAGVGTRRIPLKACKGRGRKRAAWVECVHTVLLVEFERLRVSGAKVSREFLQEIALHTITDNESPFPSAEITALVGKPIIEIVNYDWVQAFLDRCNIVTRKQSGSLSRSAEHTVYTEQLIAHHLGQLERDFQDGTLDENVVENMDETHFIFNQDNHHTLGFIGEEKVNYADVVSGGEGMTMVLRITGGVGSKIEAPFMIFKNKNSNYPILGVPDDIPGVSYRTGPRGWMSRAVFNQWLNEPRAIDKDPEGRARVIFKDNASGHSETPEQVQSLERIRSSIRFLPANSTHLCQPLDSFVIKNMKDVWRSEWEKEKCRRIESGDWSSASGKLKNPGKQYFM